MIQKISKDEIDSTYDKIRFYYEKYLKAFGVKLPKLKNATGEYTKNARILVYLAYVYPSTKKVTKKEITKFVRQFYPHVTDVQQARHLGAQKGWFIISGGRGDLGENIKVGEYKLIDLEKPYPHFHGHRVRDTSSWEDLKREYNYR